MTATIGYAQVRPCIDQSGHRFKLDMVRAETAVCERCGLIRKAIDR